MKVKKKQIIVTALLIAVCLVTLIGSSYALFTKTLSSTKKISVQAGTLRVDFAEGDRINLSNVAPMSDSDGMNTTPYTFTITNSGSVAAYYTIRNEEDSSNTLNNKYIKYRLVSDSYDSGIKTLDTMGSGYYILSSENTLAVGKSITYKLYLWLSSEADNDAQNKTYQSKIVVQSTTNSISDTVATTLLKGVGENGSIDASDPEQTFITGTDPDNYIWYSGKLWRAVSIDPSDNSVKLVTQWNISAISYNSSENNNFKDSFAEQWLNDTSVDGFLGNLREPEKFIKTDSVWNASTVEDFNSKPSAKVLVIDPVGLLNSYEYAMSYKNITRDKGYLNNNLYWRLLTPFNSTDVLYVDVSSVVYYNNSNDTLGLRPAVNLKSNIRITSGTGTREKPYRLEGDNDNPAYGTLLSARYSGEYIKFGIGENSLYRIVSHENNETKIVSNISIIKDGVYQKSHFNSLIDSVLNNTFLVNGSYLTSEQLNMLDANSIWYNKSISLGENYKLAKYDDITNETLSNNTISRQIGLLRYGELMSGQFDTYSNNVHNWLITGYDSQQNWIMSLYGSNSRYDTSNVYCNYRPVMNLKSNVVITGGDGTKSNPFTVALK